MLRNELISIHVISDSNKLLEMEDEWNRFIKNHSENPFFLSGFVKQFMQLNQSQGWTPTILVFSVDKAIVGIASLMTKKKFGVRFAKSLFNPGFSPDLILDERYRENCIINTFDFMFEALHCQFVYLTLPCESPNLGILQKKRDNKRIQFFVRMEMGHCVLPVKCTWAEFEMSRGGNLGRKFKKIERNMSRAGSWRIMCCQIENEELDIIKRVLDVERMSWKERLRTQKGREMDLELMMIWEGSKHMIKMGPDFKCNVWFLELNGQTLAHTLVIQYKEVAYFVKTSYDERYRRFAPGIHLLNAVSREFFNSRQIKEIDFLTDLPFMQNWKTICLPRVRIMISRKRAMHALIRFVLLNRPIRDLVASVSKRAPSIFDIIS